MAPQSLSRTTVRTLAELLEAVAEKPRLVPRYRQDIASAIRTAARILARPLASIPADPRLLRRRLREVTPEAVGISRKRAKNVRWLLRVAFRLTQAMRPKPYLPPLSPNWQALYDRLPTRSRRMGVGGVFRHFSKRGIEPGTVTREHAEEFLKTIREGSLLKDPERTWRDTVYAWNRCREEVAGWPRINFSFARRGVTWSLPWTTFPPHLKADVDNYLDRASGIEVADGVPPRPIREATCHLYERQFRVFASALVLRGRDPATIRGIADLTALDAYKEGLRFFLERHGGSTSSFIEGLACTLRTTAKYWVKADTASLNSMDVIVRRLTRRRLGMTAKNRQRLRPLEDPGVRHALVGLPQKLMRWAESGELHAKRAAWTAQVAVALEILLMAPMRLHNLTHLNIDKHLVRPARFGGALHIVLSRQEVKTGADLDYPLPKESTALIERYLEGFRPFLTTIENRALFPGLAGGPKVDNTLRRQITKTVFRHIGIRVNPHLFRHIAVKLHLDQFPGEHAIVTHALGNRSIDKTALHYAGLETAAAVRYFDKAVLSLHRRSRNP